jgi:hypothetical protein
VNESVSYKWVYDGEEEIWYDMGEIFVFSLEILVVVVVV